jgi:hypothetical protein
VEQIHRLINFAHLDLRRRLSVVQMESIVSACLGRLHLLLLLTSTITTITTITIVTFVAMASVSHY